MPLNPPKMVAWRTSSFCQNGECAEIAQAGDEIVLRSTRAPVEVIRLTTAEWRALVRGIQAGEFQDLA